LNLHKVIAIATYTNSLGDMKVADWREFRRMEESNSYFLY